MLGGDPSLLNHIFRPMQRHGELEGGPATLVRPDCNMVPCLKRWRRLLLNSPGAPALAAATRTPPPAHVPKWRVRTDAALQGTPSPGLGGCLFGQYWSLPIASSPELPCGTCGTAWQTAGRDCTRGGKL